MIFEFIRKLTLPFEKIEKYVPKEGKILDVGCGHGVFSEMLAQKSSQREVLGIDPSSHKVRLAKSKLKNIPNIKFRTAYLADIQGKFDCIVIIDVLYLLPDNEKVEILSRCKKLLKKNGVLILKEVDKTSSPMFFITYLEENIMVKLLKYTYSDKRELYFLNSQNYLKLFKNLGFKNIIWKSIPGIIPYPHMLFVLA